MRVFKKIQTRPNGITVFRLLTTWCLSADFLIPAVSPFSVLEGTAKIGFPLFFLVFSLQLLFLSLLACFLKDRYPQPERIVLPVALGAYSLMTVSQNQDFFYLFLLCVLWTILLQYYNEQGWLRFKKPFTKKKSIVLIAVSALLFCGIVGGAGILRYLTFRCPNFDFGIFCQMFYSMKESFLPLTTCERDQALSHFAVHFSPILYAILPVYAVFPAPITLQLAQAAILASAVVPLGLLCRKLGFSFTGTTFSAFILLCFPAVACGTNYDFHENCFLLPLLLWLFYAYETRRRALTAVFAAMVLLVKEDAAIYIAFFALFAILDGKRFLQGGLLLTGACAYFLGAVLFLSAFGEGVMAGRYNNFISGDGTLLQAVKNVLVNPAYALLQMTQDGNGSALPKILFFLQMTAPLAFLPFAAKRPSRLLLALPMLLINFMTLYVYQYNIGFQYSFGSAAFLIYLSVLNLKDLKPETGRLFLSIAAAVGCMAFFALPFSRFTGYLKDYSENVAAYRLMEQTLHQLPADGSIACTTLLLPHLSQRETVYETYYHHPKEAEKLDYIVLDARYNVDEPLRDYQALGYRIVKTVTYNGKQLLVILH